MSGQRIDEIREKLDGEKAILYGDMRVALERISELEEENQRLRATLEKREEHLAEVRRGGEW